MFVPIFFYAFLHVNIVINLLNIRCVHVELHAIKNWLSPQDLQGLLYHHLANSKRVVFVSLAIIYCWSRSFNLRHIHPLKAGILLTVKAITGKKQNKGFAP
jgi:hypothetical protein